MAERPASEKDVKNVSGPESLIHGGQFTFDVRGEEIVASDREAAAEKYNEEHGLNR